MSGAKLGPTCQFISRISSLSTPEHNCTYSQDVERWLNETLGWALILDGCNSYKKMSFGHRHLLSDEHMDTEVGYLTSRKETLWR